MVAVQHDRVVEAGDDRGGRLKASLALLFGEGPARAVERDLLAGLYGGAAVADLLVTALGEGAPLIDPPGSVGADDWVALILVETAGLSEDAAAGLLGASPQAVRERCRAAREAIAADEMPQAVVLEDNALCRSVLDRECATSGFNVAVSTAWPEIAVAAARLFRPRLAVVDIDLNGAELAGDLAAMQIREASPDCRVLFVTGYPMADKIAALMDNASAVVKPFRSSEITAAIQLAK